MHRTPNTNKGLRSRTSNAIKRRFEPRNAIGNILRQFENFEIYKDFYEKPLKCDWVARVVFFQTNPSNFRLPLQSLLLRYAPENLQAT